jgi:thiol-disulfide isomerase/thioredoxin
MHKIFVAFLLPFLASFLLQAQEPAKQAETITITTVTGKKLHIRGTKNGLDIQEYRGKILFLEFWGTQCPPCLMSIPHYIELKKKYKDKLAVLAVEVQSEMPREMLRQFVKRHKINYDVVDFRSGRLLYEYIRMRTGWRGSIPFLMIFNSQGRFVTSQVGLLPQEALEGVIKALIKIEQDNRKKSADQVKGPHPKKAGKTVSPKQEAK